MTFPRVLLLCVALGSTRAVAAQVCEQLNTAEPRQLLEAFDRASAIAPVWDDYSIANHPLVLIAQSTDTLSPSCAAIWRKGKPVQIVPATRGMRMSTPLYSLWNVDAVGPQADSGNAGITGSFRRAPREVEEALRRAGDTRAVFLPSPLDLDSIGTLGRALSAMKVNVVAMLSQLAVHESFHLHSQTPSWLDQEQRYPWPSWDRQPDRRALVANCYGPEGPIATKQKEELDALKGAWRALWGRPDSAARATALSNARRFVSARLERYRLVDSVRIPVPPAGTVGCHRAEDVMELEEGATQWIGYSTLVRAGMMAAERVGVASGEAFYDSGMLQLWIMEYLLGPEAVRELTRSIARSTSPDRPDASIFAHFQRVLEELR